MIGDIRTAAEAVGITAIITNSDEKIETQLNRITNVDQLPIMLISWNIETELTFNQHGFLNNPVSKIVCLLMDKAESTIKSDKEIKAEEMAVLFQSFIVQLNNSLVPYQIDNGPGLSGVGYTLVPAYGLGKHSGVMGRFTMKSEIVNCS